MNSLIQHITDLRHISCCSLCSIHLQRLDDALDGWMTLTQQTFKSAVPSLSEVEVVAGSISIIESQLMYIPARCRRETYINFSHKCRLLTLTQHQTVYNLAYSVLCLPYFSPIGLR